MSEFDRFDVSWFIDEVIRDKEVRFDDINGYYVIYKDTRCYLYETIHHCKNEITVIVDTPFAIEYQLYDHGYVLEYSDIVKLVVSGDNIEFYSTSGKECCISNIVRFVKNDTNLICKIRNKYIDSINKDKNTKECVDMGYTEIPRQVNKVRKFFNKTTDLVKYLMNEDSDTVFIQQNDVTYILRFMETLGYCLIDPPHQHGSKITPINFNNIDPKECYRYVNENWYDSIPFDTDLGRDGFLVHVAMKENPPLYINKIEKKNRGGGIWLCSKITNSRYLVEDCYPCDLDSLKKYCVSERNE